MKLNELFRTILHNWPVKILSLLLAVGVYLVVNYASLDQKIVHLPLEIVSPTGYTISSTVPETVELHIKADQRILYLIDLSSVRVIADFSHVGKEGTASAPLEVVVGSSLIGKEVFFSTKPDVIRLYFTKNEPTERMVQ